MLDSAVVWFGITIENALQERDKIIMGKETHYRPRYSLSRLLSPGFKLPRPPETYTGKDQAVNVWTPLLTWAGRQGSGVKRWRYVPPEERGEVQDG